MKKHIALFFLLAGSVTAMPRTVIDGSICESVSGEPVAGVNIMLKTPDGKLLAFSTSDINGEFSIGFTPVSDTLNIHATMIGYKPYCSSLRIDGKPVRIKMEIGSLMLKEVVVNAARIRENGDTIIYNVSSFARKQDKTIGDVLKRMPGIDVAGNGSIQYQGSDINRLYIEGNDLLGGKYGIATNGISFDDIGAVEVIESHQPMQVLRGLSFSDQAAINLKMKNKSKSTFLIHGSLAGGWSQLSEEALWQGDIFTMMVTGKYQMITAFKTNNTGVNLSNQLMDFISERADEDLDKYISLSVPVTPNLHSNRSYFNRSWLVSSSHLTKTGKGGEFTARIDYNNDRVSAHGMGKTTYFLESGDKMILEDRNSLSHRNAITGKFSYEVNKKTHFLKNTLSADFSWNDLTLNTAGSLPNTQNARMPEYSVSNLLKIIKRFDNNKLVTFISRNEWNSLPEKLTVTRSGESYGERIKQHSFYTDERVSLGFVFKRVFLSLDAGVAGYFRNLDTGLWGIDIQGMSDREELTTDYLRIFAAPKFEWNYKKLELTFNLPVNLYSYFFSGGLRNRTEFFISPSIAAKFRLTSGMSLTLRGSARRSPASLHNIHDSSILTDYRTFSSGVDNYYTSSGQSLSVSYNYRNALKGIFIMAMGSFGRNKSRFGSVRNIIDEYILYSYSSRPSDSRNVMVFLNASKTLEFMKGTVGLRGSFRRMKSSLISQGVETGYQNDTYSLSPTINGKISSFFNWDLRFTWNRSMLKMTDIQGRYSDDFIFSGKITLIPCGLITWTTGGELYCNRIESREYKDMLMLDTKLTFNISKHIEISASVSNILNRKSYSYITYGTVSQYEYSSRLRGREFLISIYLKK